ncbi:hypothetical protein M947_07745 [Sulfurimonas hongkongensis]|uniref:Porin domain-containing protein n=1 Tax=Sulfurimonas hongkongensis TaxID=1172190 RepID=T0KQP3_9BACT|nr:hypothetical protein [Sulfurimonas hongkongensis]EQB39344.1 hypothetical protein M947_07745 [Sulfurimonas hongkongensis]
MKKTILISLAVLTISALEADASDIKLYTDDKGQVFTTPADGRVELKSKETPLFSKSSKLQFSGTHYLGYIYQDKKNLSASDGGPIAQKSTGNFELRRNYLQVKAYLLEDPKSYLRVTLDTVYSSGKDDYADIFAKYAYIYLDDILPFTGVEIGMAHRPWIDYEEHQGWWMRSISKVFIEASEAAHLTNSADLGFNFKTKTDYFTSEIGIFNGEGYHGKNGTEEEIGSGNSAEWRLTGAFLGNGKMKRKPTKDSYFDASFYGQYNMDNSQNEVIVNGVNKVYDYKILGLHTVYNIPNFLIAAQYVQADNDGADKGLGTSQFNGEGYSINSSFRFGSKKEFSIIGRYDVWESENEVSKEKNKTNSAIYGLAWQQNKNLKWLLSGQSYRASDNRSYKGSVAQDWDSAMITAEVHW